MCSNDEANPKFPLAVGTKVFYCGKYSQKFSLDGIIEDSDPKGESYGIRNVNGNFDWVHYSKVIDAKKGRP